jgi:hypothetical protein
MNRKTTSMKFELIGLVFFASLYSTFGQSIDSIAKKYNTQVISRFGNSFKKGGERLQFSDLKYEFKEHTVSYDLYLSAHRNRTLSKILTVGVMASSIAMIVSASNRDRNGVFIALGTQMVFTLGSMRAKRRHVEQLDLALAERNKNILFH